MKSTKIFITLFSIVMMAMINPVIAKNRTTTVVKGAKLTPSKVSTRQYSYRDRGKKYTTLSKKASANYYKVGMASYYGGKFNGRKTANGEIFNENNFTAAHKTLAFGTYLLVTNLKNNRKIIVRVNDRGPFSKKRILDLSKRSARSLGMLHSGVTKVKVEALQVDANGYISGKGTKSLIKLAKKSGISLKIKSVSSSKKPNKKKITTRKKSSAKNKVIARKVVNHKVKKRSNTLKRKVKVATKNGKNLVNKKGKTNLVAKSKNKGSKNIKSNNQESKKYSSILVKVVDLKTEKEAKRIISLVKPKAIIDKNGTYYEVLIPTDSSLQASKLKRQLMLLTNHKIYTYYIE
ncbi:MAG: septal ring lytic transglycosylase RlpA family lipoprotein [Pasteurellales bacterium]|nr:MAG: septal ring lytic transglycosylase RlpA family lipoprotein [Pasteurellales bacterium]